nr:hypothetical protein [Planctomycetota bacterium]
MPDETIDQYRAQRIAKRDALTKLGVNPYAVRTPARDAISSIKAEFEKLEAASPKPAEGKH